MESVNSVVAMEIVEDEINQPIIPPRHAAIEETLKSEEETDRISTLPDGLLLEILSRLPSTETVIRTSTLSKRWRYVWTSVPTLIFKHSYTHLSYFKHFHDKRQLSDFVMLVDKTLNQRCRSKLRKFTVCTRYDARFALHVNNWIHYAINCNVEELKLRFSNLRSQPQFLLNEYFFSNSFFTDLKLHGCMFNPNGAISWKNLRSLRISNGNLKEDLIKNILSGSPQLENLILDYCYGYRRLDITSKSVKNLVFSGFRDPNNEFEVADVVQITAPNILSFKVQGNLLVRKIVLLNMSSLVAAELNCIKVGHWETIWKEEMLKAFIEKLSHAKELKIGSYCAADVLRLGAKGFDFPSNVKFDSVIYSYPDSGDTSGRDNDLSD